MKSTKNDFNLFAYVGSQILKNEHPMEWVAMPGGKIKN